jgi:hypothetical protein
MIGLGKKKKKKKKTELIILAPGYLAYDRGEYLNIILLHELSSAPIPWVNNGLQVSIHQM